jgi:hypothetical protein
MTHSEIIDALGGPSAVGAAVKSKPNSVSMWRERGIPWKRRLAVARLAKEKSVPLPADFLVDL